MQKFVLISFIIFFSACSPKYKIVKEYHSPKQTTNNSLCLALCQTKKVSCQTNCKNSFTQCKIKADKVAKKRYEEKMQNYIKELENYAQKIENYNYEINFSYLRYRKFPFFYDPFWYEPMPYIPSKPKKPSLEVERLKAQGEICQLDCGCQKMYDECFIGCGGSLVSKKLCIENCPNEK